VTALVPGARPDLSRARGEGANSARRGQRDAFFAGEWLQSEVIAGALPENEMVEGPAICELPEATVVVPPQWRGSVERDGTLVLEREP
jgi:N-methylhydantoinase A